MRIQSKEEFVAQIAGVAVGFLIAVLAFWFGWNASIHPVFGYPRITFWQSLWGLVCVGMVSWSAAWSQAARRQH